LSAIKQPVVVASKPKADFSGDPFADFVGFNSTQAEPKVIEEVRIMPKEDSPEEDGDGGWEDFSSAVPNSSRPGENAEEQKEDTKNDDPFAEIFGGPTPTQPSVPAQLQISQITQPASSQHVLA
jgi:hypothetical protein